MQLNHIAIFGKIFGNWCHQITGRCVACRPMRMKLGDHSTNQKLRSAVVDQSGEDGLDNPRIITISKSLSLYEDISPYSTTLPPSPVFSDSRTVWICLIEAVTSERINILYFADNGFFHIVQAGTLLFATQVHIFLKYYNQVILIWYLLREIFWMSLFYWSNI